MSTFSASNPTWAPKIVEFTEFEVVAADDYGSIGLVEPLSCCCSGILHVVIELGSGVLLDSQDLETRDGDAIAVYFYGRLLNGGMQQRSALSHNS